MPQFSLFYCYVDLLDLHSFPTRRSSDLNNQDSLLARNNQGENILHNAVVGDWHKDIIKAFLEHVRQRMQILRTRSEEHTSESSHTVISYAVFCLKKKNQQE